MLLTSYVTFLHLVVWLINVGTAWLPCHYWLSCDKARKDLKADPGEVNARRRRSSKDKRPIVKLESCAKSNKDKRSLIHLTKFTEKVTKSCWGD